MSEGLRPIPGWPGYWITDEGRVLSDWKRIGLGRGNGRGAVCVIDETSRHDVACFDGGRGYMRIRLSGNNRRRAADVHTLVLEAFVGPRPSGRECRHLDGNKTNNRLPNLAWGTHEENEGDRVRHGTVLRGAAHGQSRLTEQDVRTIRQQLAGGGSPTQIGRVYGITKTAVLHIKNGKTWAHVSKETSCQTG